MSTTTAWRYSINTFEVNTRGSNVSMLSLSTDTYAKLKAEESNPAIAAILAIYEPVFFAYRDLDQQYGVKAGEREGNTLGFEQYLDQMPLKLRQWESLIRAVYIEDSPEEKAIFPNKRKPFESGTYESRLDALGSLKLKTAADPTLATATTQITSFYNAALGARLVQQTSEGALGQLSDLRENQRILLADELVGVLGQVMFIHRHNLAEVERYFDLSLLRDTGTNKPFILSGGINPLQVVNLNSLAPDTNLNITAESVIRIKNTSDNPVQLTFYLADKPTDQPGPAPQFTLNPGETQEHTAADFAYNDFKNFNIYNLGGGTGKWEVEVEV